MEFGYYQYSYKYPAAQPMPFSQREIIYAVSNPLSYSMYGWSALVSIENILNILIYAMEYNEDLFEKNGVPKGILAVAGMGKAVFDIWEAHFHERVRENPDGMRMLRMNQPGEQAEWIPFTPTMDDLRFLESQEWYLKLVAASLEVNFNELGFTDTINRATAEEQSQVFKRRSIRPLLKALEYWINLELISELPFLGIEGGQFKFIPLVDSFEQSRRTAVFAQEIDKGLRMINEIRVNDLGLERIDEDWANMPHWVWQALHAQSHQPPACNPYAQLFPPSDGDGEPTDCHLVCPNLLKRAKVTVEFRISFALITLSFKKLIVREVLFSLNVELEEKINTTHENLSLRRGLC